MTLFSTIVAIALAIPTLSFPAEHFRLEGEPFRANVPVTISSSVTNIPTTIMVYRVLPQQFSKETLSNILAIADFTTKTMKLSADKTKMSWQYEENGGPIRMLEMSPIHGYISYKNHGAIKGWGDGIHGVPARAEVDKLAMHYLQLLGGDTNQICFRQRSATERRQNRFDKNTKKYGEPVATMRGVMYARELDGIRFLGAGGRGGFEIDFGNDAKVSSLYLDWRKLEPYRRYRTISRDEIVRRVMAGQTVISQENPEIPKKPTKLTITKVTHYYMSQTSGTPEEFIYPFVGLDVVAQDGATNTTTFYLDCPILSETNE